MSTVWDEEVFVISYAPSTQNQGLENYWTTEPDGDVDVWGFWRPILEVGFIYDPVIRLVDAPLYLGKTWSQTVDVYTLPGPVYSGTIELTYEVLEEGTVVVSGGSYYSFGIGQNLPAGLPAEFPATLALDGTELGMADRT